MIDKEEEAEAEAPVLETPETDAPVSETQEPAAVSPEIETAAREMGWVPQSEWRGDKSLWKPADEFKRRGDEVLPIVQSRAKRAEQKVHDLEQRLTTRTAELEKEFADRMERMERMSQVAMRKALDRQADELHRSYEAKKFEAVKDGDTAAYEKLNAEQSKHLARIYAEADDSGDEPAPAPVVRKAAPPQKNNGGLPPEKIAVVQKWVSANEWFNRDNVMTTTANAYHEELLREQPGLSLEENLDQTEKFVRESFPGKFSKAPAAQQKPSHAPQVEGGGRASGINGSAKSWSTLPPEAKQAADRQIKNDGLFLPKGVTSDTMTDADIAKARATYAKDYYEQF